MSLTHSDFGPAAAAGIAVATWCAMATIAYLLAVTGRRGPFEVALRTMVARTERRRPIRGED